MFTKSFFGRYLTLGFLLFSLNAFGQADCKEIEASIKVLDANQGKQNGSVKIDFKGQANSNFIVHLVGPKAYFQKDLKETEVKELKQGGYTLVLTGRKEKDNFCQKHFEFIIK